MCVWSISAAPDWSSFWTASASNDGLDDHAGEDIGAVGTGFTAQYVFYGSLYLWSKKKYE